MTTAVAACVSCRSQYSVVDYNAKKKYVCKKCAGALLLPGEIPADIPEEARLGSHHVKGKHGETVKFRNPHPSAGGPPESPFAMTPKILW